MIMQAVRINTRIMVLVGGIRASRKKVIMDGKNGVQIRNREIFRKLQISLFLITIPRINLEHQNKIFHKENKYKHCSVYLSFILPKPPKYCRLCHSRVIFKIQRGQTISLTSSLSAVGVRRFERPTTRPPDAYSNRAELHPEIL